ncbi:DUF6124 family protein [Pseudomonas sp. St316]|uniref:DUF6124 family protein n=1 Tax=Pseudomonas sp. St316 TaxID=2678257 RepID=UPI001BB3DB4E|nr:DUF6124 family protein [Pseudomonas sp. St316]BBP58583.1 hypothetical protein PHLH4_21730 [Pseudomonas sp. St316]
MLPLGGEAAPKRIDPVFQRHRSRRFYDCCAAEREQAPSPHTESLLANLSETLASANAMPSDLAFDLEGSRRHIALGIQQLIELSGQMANRALDNVEAR